MAKFWFETIMGFNFCKTFKKWKRYSLVFYRGPALDISAKFLKKICRKAVFTKKEFTTDIVFGNLLEI